MLASSKLQTIVLTSRHDADGVVTAPDGSRVVWFRDPDGNLLSIVQYSKP